MWAIKCFFRSPLSSSNCGECIALRSVLTKKGRREKPTVGDKVELTSLGGGGGGRANSFFFAWPKRGNYVSGLVVAIGLKIRATQKFTDSYFRPTCLRRKFPRLKVTFGNDSFLFRKPSIFCREVWEFSGGLSWRCGLGGGSIETRLAAHVSCCARFTSYTFQDHSISI